jgi:beta-galactosidase GanA
MKVTPPYFGAAYYPEAWPVEQIDDDIALMKQAGMNVMRIGEFAWSSMEPAEGAFDFAWLHHVVDKLAAAGIGTILCTPTCTPPAWLAEKYPEILIIDDAGRQIGHGGRRHACPNSPVYRDHCARIVTKTAGEFGQDANLVGWQIDNEVHPHGQPPGRGCFCPVCKQKFRDGLRAKFGTIGKLNAAWGTNLWSQAYQSFDQLHGPVRGAWHHQSLYAAYTLFQGDSYVEFCHQQADILHRLTRQPVGTDMMPTTLVSYERMNRTLDVVQHNHYHDMPNLWQSAMWFDYSRPVKPVPFWNTETSTCWNGSHTANRYRESGFCRANSWIPVALGGEAVLYWLWRSHWSGQELMHGSVVSSAGRPLHMFAEVQEIAAGFKAAADFITRTRPAQPKLAMHLSNWAQTVFESQGIVEGFDYRTRVVESFYHPIIQAQYRLDVIDAAAPLTPYALLVSPYLVSLEEAALRDRLLAWIEAGGTWIAGPWTDVRDLHAAKYRHAPFGSIEDWAGIYCKQQIPGIPRDFAIRWADGTMSRSQLWCDGFELRQSGVESLADYTEGELAGLSAVAARKVGKGRIIVLGTQPDAAALQGIIAHLAKATGVVPVGDASENLLVVPRKGPAGEGQIVVEHEHKPATLTLPRAATDLLTGKSVPAGRVEIEPYGVKVLKY